MIVDIICWFIVMCAVGCVILLALALCKSASDYDDITEEYWNEYWENKDEKSV